MSNIKFWDVYEGGRTAHRVEPIVRKAVAAYHNTGKPIPDDVAQPIAAWFHSAAEPYTTRLSTVGIVDRYLTREHFASDAEVAALSQDDKLALTALMYYVHRKQTDAISGSRPCACDDCMDTAIGKAGELCSECSEAGCSATEHDMCEREDAYASDCD